MSNLEIESNGCMTLRVEEQPFPCFENGEAKFSVWISSSSCDQNLDEIIAQWYGSAEVGFLIEFTPSQLLERVYDWYESSDGIDSTAKESLQKMRAELVSMIERIDQMEFVDVAA